MNERHHLKLNFLKEIASKESVFTNYELHPIAADASFRTYDRVKSGGKNFMLMNSPPEHYSLTPFIEVAELLRFHNLPAPEIYHIDETNGFMLLEDFGIISVKDLMTESPNMQQAVYTKIVELLVEIQKIPAPHLKPHSMDKMLEGLEVFADWYVPYRTGKHFSIDERAEYLGQWREVLSELPEIKVLTLRDFHVENLMYTEDKIGLLDFQDASLSHPAYDLVSLLEDARHDVPYSFAQEMIEYYFSLNPKLDREEFLTAYNILGAQRNSRILGYFARKAKRDGAEKYLAFIPRVLGYLERDMCHESLKPLKKYI